MTADDIKQFFLHWNDEVWNNKRLELVDDLVAEGYVRHDPSLPSPIRGRDSLKQLIESYFTAFPDLHLTPEQMVAEGDKIAVLQSSRGTNTGELMGNPATGKAVTVSVMEIFRIEDGRIAEQWVNLDVQGMLKQLGLG